jgi:hypothetical protein
MSGKMMGAIGLDETITDLTDKLILLGILAVHRLSGSIR